MKKFGFNLILAATWSLFGFCVLFSSLRSQLVVSENIKEVVNKFFPQGWGFFTKNPRDMVLRIYKVKNEKLVEIDIANQSLENRLGCSRSSRMVGYEISKVAENIKISDWKQNLTGNINDHIKDKSIEIRIKFDLKHLKRGEYLLKLYRPIPYAWARCNQEKFNPFSVAKIHIK